MLGNLAELPTSHQRALFAATQLLIDSFLEDIVALHDGDAFAETFMSDQLPPRYLPRYNAGFARRFLACLYTVAWKLYSPHDEMLACTGEELALNAVIEWAEATLQEEGNAADFDALYETAFQDLDFKLLFEGSSDGIEDSRLGQWRAVANLKLGEWFESFANGGPVHPYLMDAPKIRRRRRPGSRQDEQQQKQQQVAARNDLLFLHPGRFTS